MRIDDIAFPAFIVAVFISLGLIINAGFNQEMRVRDCKMELAKQTKLDTSNIIHLCK